MSRRPFLPIRLRKLIGTVVLVAIVILYALVAMALAVRLLPGTAWWVQLAFFFVGGFLWILPSMLVIRWMLRPDDITPR
jgi:hypothetical protein